MDATMDPDTVAAVGIFTAFALAGMILLVMIAIYVVVCALLHALYKAVPEQHRQLSTGLVWLLLIPFWNLIWNFFVFPKLSRSYQTWFEAKGDTSKGTCNSELAWTFAILCACSIVLGFIPCVAQLAGVAALVILIIYLVKMFSLKNEAIATAAAAPTAGQMPPPAPPPPTAPPAPEAPTPPETPVAPEEPGPPTDQGIPDV